MIARPSRYVARFLEASPETVTFHVEVPETDEQKRASLDEIREAGAGAGLAVSPGTSIESVRPFLATLDVVMVMTVEPGFGGQRFMASAAPKLAHARDLFASAGVAGSTHVDGGISRDTAEVAGAWGADVLIVGSALFQRGRDAADEVRLVRERAAEGRRNGPDEELTAALPARALRRVASR
jgi:ribulose-phosphate 3-epimerase